MITAVASRREERAIPLEASTGVVFGSSAGPVELVPGVSSSLTYRASWLARGPQLSMLPAGPGSAVGAAAGTAGSTSASASPVVELDLDCPSRWPCRASSALVVPTGLAVEATTEAGPVTVGAVDAAVRIRATDRHEVIVGPMRGTLDVATDGGDIVGTGLAATRVEVRTVDGEIELVFRERPERVDVVAGAGPVTIELPPGRYAVSVEGSQSADIDVSRDEAAASRIIVEGRGPIRILETTP